MNGSKGQGSDISFASFQLMATCPKGLESPLSKELVQLGAQSVAEGVAAVFFEASLDVMYRVMS